MEKVRLDEALVMRGHYASRSRARDAIKRGCIRVNGAILRKPSQAITPSHEIASNDPAEQLVSRAGLKLEHGLNYSGIQVNGAICLDLGASTGGFTQVLLTRGAAHVIAVDVGNGQLHSSLCAHPNVTNLEHTNARALTLKHLAINQLGEVRPNILVSDMSFISLKLALPAALELACPGAKGIFLVKPQFEVGREHLAKNGVVKDVETAKAAAVNLQYWLDDFYQWQAQELIASPIKGGDGNLEFLLIGEKQGA